mmetsp:Transcript_23314/g.51240  ORF Transcript_23314/g.51240 Transcript_23314/m.51240 type:complete len:387 (-) Transcript_23314:207-1367(-)
MPPIRFAYPKELSDDAKPQQQLNFGKRLAHTDKVVRDRGLSALKQWLGKNTELERLDFLKIWKGLWYGMWMSDKRPVQQDLAVQIALLVNSIAADKRHLWLDTFWETCEVHWDGLDTHRMNKYYLFVRIVIAEFFKIVRETKWDEEFCKKTMAILTRSGEDGSPPANHKNNGLMLHLSMLFWDELIPQLEEKPEAPLSSVMILLEPFCILAERSRNVGLVKRTHEYVLRKPPQSVREALLERLLNALSNPLVPNDNMKALGETARVLGATTEQAPEPEPEAPKRQPKALGTYIPKDRKQRKKAKQVGKDAKAAKAAAAEGSTEGGSAAPASKATAAAAQKKREKKKGDRIKKGAEKEPVKKGGRALKRKMRAQAKQASKKKGKTEA